jgi:uncharacterized protein
MAVQVSYPGVYVQEVPSGVRTIVGVATSIGCFIGRAASGRMFTPTRVQNLTDFIRIFGDDPTFGDLSRYVRLFFLNGGTDCYVTRIADKMRAASTITLQNEAKASVLALTALSAGTLGDTIRVSVDYNTPTPEQTFNLRLFQSTTDSRGQPAQANGETWTNLSMDPASPFYAPTVLTQKSSLVNATDVGPAKQNGHSLSSVPIAFDGAPADFRAKFAAALGGSSPHRSFRISVDGQPDLQPGAGGTISLKNFRKDIIIELVIGIGRHLAMPPLPHHRAYGSVPRRFAWVKPGRRRGVGEDRVRRNSGCAGLVGPRGVRTCARTPSGNRRRPLH